MRENIYASYLLTILRIYVGWSWLTAGYHKIAAGFDASGFFKIAIGKMNEEYPSVSNWWGKFIEEFALPNVGIFNFLIPWGEFLVGLGLILGCLTTVAIFFGMVMNFSFLFSGTLSNNPMMILLSTLIIVAGLNAGKIGLDRWLIPYLRSWYKS